VVPLSVRRGKSHKYSSCESCEGSQVRETKAPKLCFRSPNVKLWWLLMSGRRGWDNTWLAEPSKTWNRSPLKGRKRARPSSRNERPGEWRYLRTSSASVWPRAECQFLRPVAVQAPARCPVFKWRRANDHFVHVLLDWQPSLTEFQVSRVNGCFNAYSVLKT
jgi:hypothetical protein